MTNDVCASRTKQKPPRTVYLKPKLFFSSSFQIDTNNRILIYSNITYLLYISKGQIKISLPYILSETLLPPVPGNLKSLTQSSFPVNIWSWGLLARWTTKLCPVWLWWRASLYWLWLCREAIMKTFEMACYLDWMQVFKGVTKSFERAKSVFIQDEGVHVCPRWIDGL